jgi:hypothetical protein
MPRPRKMDWGRVARDARAVSHGRESVFADVDDLTPEERRELKRPVPPRLQIIVDCATSEMNTMVRKFGRLEIPQRDQQYEGTVSTLKEVARRARELLPANAPPACHIEITDQLEKALMRLGPPPPPKSRPPTGGRRGKSSKRKRKGAKDDRTKPHPQARASVSGSYTRGVLHVEWTCADPAEKIDSWSVLVRANRRTIASRQVRGGARRTVIPNVPPQSQALSVRVSGHSGPRVTISGTTLVEPTNR